MTKEGCMNHLRTFYPEARDEDWQLYTAGKRVQVIKDTKRNTVKDSFNLVQKLLTLKTTLLSHY